MFQRRVKMQGLRTWFLVTIACPTLIIERISCDVIIKPVNGKAGFAPNIVQYVLFTGSRNTNYNHARATCQAIGGDLAKVESDTKRNQIKSLDESFFSKDIWTGLAENVDGSPKWVSDCQPADLSLLSDEDWTSDDRCFRLQSSGLPFDRRRCTDIYDFLCEMYREVTESECNVNPTSTDSVTPDDDCVTTTSTTPTSSSQTTTTTTAITTTLTPPTTTISTPITTSTSVPTKTTTSTTTTPIATTTTNTITTPTTTTTTSMPITTTTTSSTAPTATTTTSPTTSTTSTTTTSPTTATTQTTTSPTTTTTPTTTIPTTTTTTLTMTTTTTTPTTTASTTTTTMPTVTTTTSPTTTWPTPTTATTPTTTTTTPTTPTTPTTTTTTSPTTTTTSTTTTTTSTTSTSVLTTVSTWSSSPADDCGDCFCVLAANITVQEAQSIADQISKNLTVDAKSTSAYRRTLESADDHRPSAKAFGFVGIIFIIIPFGVLILSDVKTMIQGAVDIRNVYKL